MTIYDPAQTTFHDMIKWQHLLTPIAIDWFKLGTRDPREEPRAYKTLYIFGIRVATWRTDQ